MTQKFTRRTSIPEDVREPERTPKGNISYIFLHNFRFPNEFLCRVAGNGLEMNMAGNLSAGGFHSVCLSGAQKVKTKDPVR